MKLKIKYSLFILFAAIASSCEDFLQAENKSNITAENYFVTADGYESLVAASYSTLRDVWGDDPWLFALGVDIYTRGESENVGGSYQGRDVQSSELNEYKNLNSTNTFVYDFYRFVYRAI